MQPSAIWCIFFGWSVTFNETTAMGNQETYDLRFRYSTRIVLHLGIYVKLQNSWKERDKYDIW